jgi:hypothetical protein
MNSVYAIVGLAFVVMMVASIWKVFEKAGQPGWAALVPIYNILILLKITGKPAWWVVLFLVPFANFVVMIMVVIALAKTFGKSTGFAIGMLFVGFIFYPILGFGDAQYSAPQLASA